MRVRELAEELRLPVGSVVVQCRRLGLEADGTDAVLSAGDVVVLRAELATGRGRGTERGETGTGQAPVSSTERVGVPTPVTPLAPPDVEHPAHQAARPAPPRFAGDVVGAGWASASGSAETEPPTGGDGAARRSAPGPPPARTRSRTDPGIRRARIALPLAVLIAIGANFSSIPALIVGCWVLVALFLIVALVAANGARSRITVHPESRSGLGLAMALMAGSTLGLVVGGLTVWTVVRSEPAADAPLGLGDLNSVERARWGYLRLSAVADVGWRPLAKEAGTCWEATRSNGRDTARREERVELGERSVSCDQPHQHEVLGSFAFDTEPDSAYPGVAAFEQRSMARCEPILDGIADLPSDLVLGTEYPTEAGWQAGDHDITCVATAQRAQSLLD